MYIYVYTHIHTYTYKDRDRGLCPIFINVGLLLLIWIVGLEPGIYGNTLFPLVSEILFNTN